MIRGQHLLNGRFMKLPEPKPYRMWCCVCLDDFAEPDDTLCLVCGYERQRREKKS